MVLGRGRREAERRIAELEGALAEAQEGLSASAQRDAEIHHLSRIANRALTPLAYAAATCGAAIAWTAARISSEDLPQWPGWTMMAVSFVLSVTAIASMKYSDAWDRNMQTLKDNVLLMIVTTLVGLAIALGLAVVGP